MFGRILLDPQGGEGNGTDTPPPAAEKAAEKGPDLAKAVEGLVARHGDPTAALRVLMGENYTLRDRVREASGRLPKDGAVVLEGDDAASWRDLSALGNPAEIRSAIDSGKAAAAKVAEYARKELIGEASAAHGFNAKVLATLAGADLAIEVRDGTHLGRPVRVAEVVTVEKDARGADVEKRTPLEKYAERAWPEFLPSLRGQKAPAPAGSPPAPGGQPRPAIDPQTFRRSLVK